jgi:uncharacterized membrane protein YgcG
LQDLDEAAQKYLAWESILAEKVTLNLDPQQVRQAETQKATADGVVTARIPETYFWMLVPEQRAPQAPIELKAVKLLPGQDALAVRASKRLRSDECLLTTFAGTRLRMELDRVPLWRGSHVAVQQLVKDFATYLYLPRLKDSTVLVGAVHDGIGQLLWEQDTFAFADDFDETVGRYRGLRVQAMSRPADDTSGLIVKPEIARRQLDVEPPGGTGGGAAGGGGGTGGGGGGGGGGTGGGGGQPKLLKRFHGTVTLDATRVGRDAGRIGDEVIAHLPGLVDAKVLVTLEISAEIPSGAPPSAVRAVTEKGRTLKFSNHGFENE